MELTISYPAFQPKPFTFDISFHELPILEVNNVSLRFALRFGLKCSFLLFFLGNHYLRLMILHQLRLFDSFIVYMCDIALKDILSWSLVKFS